MMQGRGQRKQQSKPSERERAEERYQDFVEKRNGYNETARQARHERDALHDQRSTLMQDVIALRDAMRENTRLKRKHQQARNASRKRALKLIEVKKKKFQKGRRTSPRETVDELMRQIVRADDRLETTEMSLADERNIIDKLRILRRSLAEQQAELERDELQSAEVEELDREIDAKFAEAEERHRHVVELAQANQQLYDKVTTLMDEATHLTGEADRKHKEFLAAREKADHHHERAMEMRAKLSGYRKEVRAERDAGRRLVSDGRKRVRQALQDEKKLKQVADEALQELLAGGKISL